jgi:hypothetical protein
MIPDSIEDKFPPIKVIVVEGKEDITIKISGEGGGIPRSAMGLIWMYMYTMMESGGLEEDFHVSDFKAPMAGFGYGLPLSQLVSVYCFLDFFFFFCVLANAFVGFFNSMHNTLEATCISFLWMGLGRMCIYI